MEPIFFDDEVKELIKEKSKRNESYNIFNEYTISRTQCKIEEMWNIYYIHAPKNFKKICCKIRNVFIKDGGRCT